MTFDCTDTRNHPEKSVKYNSPEVQPHIIDDDNNSAISEAVVSHTSKKPFNNGY